MGRVCYHTCETACNRGGLDESVGINSVERFLGDNAIEKGWHFTVPAQHTGKRVLVVGAGPAGLSAAYHLRRMGHDVTVYEGAELPGGMMRYGILSTVCRGLFLMPKSSASAPRASQSSARAKLRTLKKSAVKESLTRCFSRWEPTLHGALMCPPETPRA